MYRKPKGKVFTEAFIFGIFEEEIQRSLNLPLLCCLVEPSDWISYSL